MFKKVFFAALWMSSAAVCAKPPVAPARQAAPASRAASLPALTPDQQAQIKSQAEALARDSLKIAVAIDQGQAVQVWDKASSVAKLTKRQDFARQIFIDRSKLGAPSSRKRVAITFAQSKGGNVPAGLYININYATQFAREKKPVRELISYHLDNDKVWRVSGYSVR